MHVVADTNVIISMLFWGKSLEKLLFFVNTRKIILCFSPQTIHELLRVIQYKHIASQAETLNIPVEKLIDKLLASSIIVYPTAEVSAVHEDKTDNRILEAAIAANVAYILSGDKHLLSIKKFRGVSIVTPAQFLKFFKKK